MTYNDMKKTLKGYKWTEKDNGEWLKGGRRINLQEDGLFCYQGKGITVAIDVEEISIHGPYRINMFLSDEKVEIDL